MNPKQLRHRYPTFTYDNFSYQQDGQTLQIKFAYSISTDHDFTHQLSLNLPKDLQLQPTGQLDNYIFHLGLSLIPSYWKLTCSPHIQINAGNLNPNQILFWHKLLLKGMGEYFYRNSIDFTAPDFLKISSNSDRTFHESVSTSPKSTDSVLVPVGGGKDSIVTLELLKSHFHVIPFIINSNPIMTHVLETAGATNPVTIKSTIDPILFDLNQQGFLNGHVPISAFYSFAAALSAHILGIKYVAFSNERSSNEGNTTYLNHEINHQYSKTLEFETDLNSYLASFSHLNIFSFLRPLFELQITKIFSKYPKYFTQFTSCNRNFTLTKIHTNGSGLWCNHCPKCVSTGLMLGCFIGKQQVSDIMGTYPPDLPENQAIVADLVGETPIKPFECVLTRREAKAALNFSDANRISDYDQILSSWEDNPNLPEQFAVVLKKSIS